MHLVRVTVFADVSTFELSSFPAFSLFAEKLPWPYVEVMGSILQAKHSASSVSVMSTNVIFLVAIMHSLGLKLIFYKILISHVQKSKKITLKSAVITWHDGISHQFWFRNFEMMSAACIPVVPLKRRSFQSFYTESLLTRLAFRWDLPSLRIKLEVRCWIWTYDSFQLSIPWCYAKFPVMPCIL